MTTISASLTNLTALLPQSHDCSCYVNRRILTPAPLQLLEKKMTCAHKTLRNHPACDNSLGSLTLPAPELGDFVELLFLYCTVADAFMYRSVDMKD